MNLMTASKLLVPVALAASAIVAYATPHVDQRYNFEFAIPAGWRTADLTGYAVPGELRVALTPDGVSSITVFVQKPLATVDAAEFLAALVADYESIAGAEIRKKHEGKLAGHGAASILVVGNGTGSAFGTGTTRTAVHWIAFPRGSDVLCFYLTTPEDKLDAHEDAFRALCRTLKIGDAPPNRPSNLDFELGTGALDLPEDWGRCGGVPPSGGKGYAVTRDGTVAHSGKASARIETISRNRDPQSFGTLTQATPAGPYHGKRVRLSGFLKTKDVARGYAGLWLRADGEIVGRPLAFDNMARRPLVGTVDWKRCEIVLDIPEEARGLHYGALLVGEGTVWVDDLTLEAVGADIPTTAP